MRLVSYLHDGDWRAGLLIAEDVFALPGSVRDLIALPARDLTALVESATDDGPVGRLNELGLGPPIPDPEKILCLGLNYRDHAAESGMPVPSTPVVFAKFRNSLVGSGAPVVLPRVSEQIDYEGELAVVIGSRAKEVSERDALDHVAGYMPFNDISARDLQLATSQWTPGKALDTFGPCGPALVLAAEVPDPQALRVRTRVNGRLVQDGSTADMIFPVAQTIAFLSSAMTLEPGDLVVTGTPAGVGFTRKPPLFLRDGDVVEVEIDGLGTLINPVVAAQRVDGPPPHPLHASEASPS